MIPNCCNIQYKTSSRNGCVAVVPPLAKSSSSSNQTLYDHSFAVLGPKLWNKVPSTVRAAPTFDAFKISLSNFLDLIPDNLPVAGCTAAVGQTHWLISHQLGGQTSDDPSDLTDEPHQLTKLVSQISLTGPRMRKSGYV